MKTIRNKIANRDAFIRRGSYNPHNIRAFLIGNQFGLLAIAYASCAQDALNEAVDADLMDSELMSADDYAEYEHNEWHDSCVLAGNASEPFWSEYLWISEHE